jgi:hypothetical protein
MSLTFNGSKNLKKQGAVSMNWSISPDVADDVTKPVSNVPGIRSQIVVGLAWFGYSLDPVANQGAFTFGTALAMQLSLSRPRSFYASDSSYFIGGRVVVYIPSTGQTFIFGPNRIGDIAYAITGTGITAFNVLENDNVVVPISLAQGSQIQVWFEQDFDSSTGIVTSPQTQAIVTLFNFPVSPVEAN